MKKMATDELNALLKRLGLSDMGVEIAQNVRNGEAFRPKPQVRQDCMRGLHVSTPMRFTVSCNDTLLQFPLLHKLDDPYSGCIEFYSWPMDVRGVIDPNVNGARVAVTVLRPFLVEISDIWCGFVDVFPNSMLRKSVARGCGLHEEVRPGHWVSAPFSKSLTRHGIEYQILKETNVNARSR